MPHLLGPYDDDSVPCPSGILSNASTVKGHVLASASTKLPFASMIASIPGVESTLGERLRFAFEREHRTQTAVESALMVKYPEQFKHRGVISNYVNGKKGTLRPDPRIIKLVADELHVELEWLLIGTGPMTREGRSDTPAEEAMRSARDWGIREDAWQLAWERNKDRAATMTAIDWFDAIRLEADHLNRANVPRPEQQLVEQMDHRAKVRRTKKQKAKVDAQEQEHAPEMPPVSHPRVANGK